MFIIGMMVGCFLVLLAVMIGMAGGEKCLHCGSTNTSRQYLTASYKRFLVCHKCGWEEGPLGSHSNK